MSQRGGSTAGGGAAATGERKQGGGNKLLFVAMVAVAAMIGLGLTQAFTSPPAAKNAQPPVASGATPAPGAVKGSVVRENSYRLEEAADGKVTLVEFLDFECESCGAVHPVIEQLRQQYQGRVTFVVRYFPLDGHFNSKRAARAVEAAARQGKFEAMYQKMFATQREWGEQQTAKDDVFRGYAQALRLDMARWDADYASAATAARIQTDLDDGRALGLTGTPSFFLNGKPFSPESVEDLTRALDDALAA